MRRRFSWVIGGGVVIGTVVAALALSEPLPVARSVSDAASFPGSVGDRFDALPDRANRGQSLERTGLVGPDAAIAVANLTVEPGRYLVKYEFESRMIGGELGTELECGLVDNNGVDRFLVADEDPVTVGLDWKRHVVQTTFSLPDATLGIRCYSVRPDLVHALFRDVSLSAVRITPPERP